MKKKTCFIEMHLPSHSFKYNGQLVKFTRLKHLKQRVATSGTRRGGGAPAPPLS